MALKQDIVIRNRFGAKAGKTPGRYVRRYTARESATEPLTPYSIHDGSLSDYVGSYMARSSASDDEISKFSNQVKLKNRDDLVTPQSSRVFGDLGLVYTQNDMDKSLDMMDKAIEDDHTFMTTIVSFTHEYLQRQNVVPSDMPAPKHKGDYMGHVDQLKLRRALCSGVDKMLKKLGFVEPKWAGTVQLDTLHVHAHLAIIETSDNVPESRIVKSPVWEFYNDEEGRRRRRQVKDTRGRLVFEELGERGVINDKAKATLRRGLDVELKKTYASKAFINDITAHRQLVKDKAIELSFENNSVSELVSQIYEALPKKDNLNLRKDAELDLKAAQKNWRADSNRVDMKKANDLAKRYANMLIKRHALTLGIVEFNNAVDRYAQNKVDKDEANRDVLIKKIKKVANDRLKTQLINQLYRRLKPIRLINDEKLRSKALLEQENKEIDLSNGPFFEDIEIVEPIKATNVSRIRSFDDIVLKDKIADSFYDGSQSDSRLLSLEQRLRSYPLRLQNAVFEKNRYTMLLKTYETLEKQGLTSEESLALKNLYFVEKEYNEGLVDKYSYLMNQMPPKSINVQGYNTVLPANTSNEAYKSWIVENKELLEQPVLSDFVQNNEIERENIDIVNSLPDIFQNYLKQQYGENVYLTSIQTDTDAKYQLKVLKEIADKTREYEETSRITKDRFDDVKSYDMLDVIYDLDSGFTRSVSQKNIDIYKDVSNKRSDAVKGGLEYLESTNQTNTKAYEWYSKEYRSIAEDIDFSNKLDKHKVLAKPIRRYLSNNEDEKEDLYLLPVSKAYSVLQDISDEQKKAVLSEKTRVNDLNRLQFQNNEALKAMLNTQEVIREREVIRDTKTEEDYIDEYDEKQLSQKTLENVNDENNIEDQSFLVNKNITRAMEHNVTYEYEDNGDIDL